MKNKEILYVECFKHDNFNYFIGITNKGLAYVERENDFINKYDFELRINKYKTKVYKETLIKYFNKEIKVFNLDLDLLGTKFQVSVWKELMKINYGTTLCYSEVASKLGDIKKTRAVANAIAKNNILIIVPCHRVLSKDNRLNGFSSGLDLKQYLLDLEGVTHYKK